MSTSENVATMTAIHLGADGTQLIDDPVETAERQARLADELAALADQLITVLEHQAAALDLVTPTDEHSAGALRLAATINTRAARSVELIRDSLGEQHVVCDELAERLRQLLPGSSDDAAPIGRPRFATRPALAHESDADRIEGGEAA